MIRVTRRYRFSASHRLHAPPLSEAANRALYGKCNNPFGHGHNYLLEVSARGPIDPETGYAVNVGLLDELVHRVIISPFDHKNLNTEIPEFAAQVPTTENLGLEILRRLRREWPAVLGAPWPVLEKTRIAETERNIFEVSQ